MGSYPKGTKFQAWCMYTETQRGVPRPVIKRWVEYPTGTKRCERLPVIKYAPMRDNPGELANFLIRLNAEHRKELAAKSAVQIKHAYINDSLLERYQNRRHLEVPSKDRVSTEMHYLRRHFLNFFLGLMNLTKPEEWYRCHRDEWATYLLTDRDVPVAPATKREIIQAANRFMAWLHEERPAEVPELTFRPISKERFKDLNARREIDPAVKRRTFIRPEHWVEIKKNLPPELEPFALLAYCYGARRGEVLGFLPGDVKKGHLSIERQLEHMGPEPAFKPTKGKLKRTVPHWFAQPKDAYKWLESVQKYRVDPDALTDLWNDVMEALGYSYDFHDLRHTFITRALREHNHRDVQMAAGHKHLKTTMGYAHDDRTNDNEEFRPN